MKDSRNLLTGRRLRRNVQRKTSGNTYCTAGWAFFEVTNRRVFLLCDFIRSMCGGFLLRDIIYSSPT